MYLYGKMKLLTIRDRVIASSFILAQVINMEITEIVASFLADWMKSLHNSLFYHSYNTWLYWCLALFDFFSFFSYLLTLKYWLLWPKWSLLRIVSFGGPNYNSAGLFRFFLRALLKVLVGVAWEAKVFNFFRSWILDLLWKLFK